MGKRSDFDRKDRDYYVTPPEAIDPVLKHLPTPSVYPYFCEPCAGNGAMVDYLQSHGYGCAHKSDIEPQTDDIKKADALKLYNMNGDFIITNPPWEKRPHEGEIFNRLLAHWLNTFNGDIWLLFDADWMHTEQAQKFSKRCKKVVSVGRISWEQNGVTGKDSCAWYCFNHSHEGGTEFIWRNSYAKVET